MMGQPLQTLWLQGWKLTYDYIVSVVGIGRVAGKTSLHWRDVVFPKTNFFIQNALRDAARIFSPLLTATTMRLIRNLSQGRTNNWKRRPDCLRWVRSWCNLSQCYLGIWLATLWCCWPCADRWRNLSLVPRQNSNREVPGFREPIMIFDFCYNANYTAPLIYSGRPWCGDSKNVKTPAFL